jgi:hypothetical protein
MPSNDPYDIDTTLDRRNILSEAGSAHPPREGRVAASRKICAETADFHWIGAIRLRRAAHVVARLRGRTNPSR